MASTRIEELVRSSLNQMVESISNKFTLAWAFAQAWVGKGASAVAYIALGYLLPPEEFGAYAVAATFLTLAELFVEQTISQTAIQLPDDETGSHSDLQSVAVVLGAMCSMGCILQSIYLYWQNPDSNVALYAAAISLCPLLIGMNAVSIGLLRKRLDYQYLTQRTALATGVGGAVGVVTAIYVGNGLSLVAMATLYQLVSWFLLRPHRPQLSRRFDMTTVRRLKKLILINSYPKIADFLETKGVELLVAYLLGLNIAGALAYATKIAQTAFTFLIAPTIDAAWGQFGKLRTETNLIEKRFEQLSTIVSVMGLPAFLLLAIGSDRIAPYLLGDRWILLYDLLPLLCLSLLTRSHLYLATIMAQVLNPDIRLSLISLLRASLTVGLSAILMVEFELTFTAVIGFLLAGLLVVYPTMRRIRPISRRVSNLLFNETFFSTLAFISIWIIYTFINALAPGNLNIFYNIFSIAVCAGLGIIYVLFRHLTSIRVFVSDFRRR